MIVLEFVPVEVEAPLSLVLRDTAQGFLHVRLGWGQPEFGMIINEHRAMHGGTDAGTPKMAVPPGHFAPESMRAQRLW